MTIIPFLQYLAGGSLALIQSIPIIGPLTSYTTTHFPDDIIYIFSLVIFLAILARATISYFNNLMIYKMSEKICMHLSEELYDRFINSSMAFHNVTKRGTLINVINKEASQVSCLVENVICSIVSTVPLITYISILLFMSAKTTLFLIVYILLLMYIVNIFIKHLKSVSRFTIIPVENVQTTLVEGLSAIPIIKLFASYKFEIDKFRKALLNSYSKRLNLRKWKLRLPPFLEMSLLITLLIFINLFVFLNGKQSISLLVGYILVIFRAIPIVQSLNDRRAQFASLSPSVSRINEVISIDNPIQYGTINDVIFKNKLSFKSVSFEYSIEKVVLNDLSVDIKKGQKIAFVGQSGAGKSTILNLLSRMYRANGAIEIDGIDINNFSEDAWAKFIGYVQQDTFLFSDTIKNNISYPLNSYSMNEIVEAAKLANAHSFITSLPKGYDTIVGERGCTLSGGQKQRISIARMIIRNPELILLDEMSSALDSESEKFIQQSLDSFTINKTVMAASHRMSSIINFDCIFVLENGNVIETGSPKELLNRKEYFYRLVNMQRIY
ncbi:MAG: ABC transporter ATP-binding protein [Oligoflexia bacterium]|nr:ABC transporter ATP-binding protein [Oligoflexia bacterium]